LIIWKKEPECDYNLAVVMELLFLLVVVKEKIFIIQWNIGI